VAQATTQLNATEQDTLVKQIGLALLRAAPREWRRVTASFRAVGRYHELTGEVLTEDGTTTEWMATHDITTLFGRLRAGMYREGRGTWFNARYQLDHPSSYNLEYDREEPRWDLQPPPQAYTDELRMFPRSEENVPEWLMRRMSGLAPEQPGPRFRMARIFDGQGPDGRPVFNRPDLDADELDRLYEYLSAAPVVLSERGLDLDRLASPPAPKVPVAFHTDGTWIWPAAINYYLQEYGIAPEGELVGHIQATGFRLPEVPEQTLHAAGAHLTRGNQPPPPRPPRPMPEQAAPPEPPPAPPAPEPTTYAEPVDHVPAESFDETPPPPPAPRVDQPTIFTPMVDLNGGPPTVVQPPMPELPEPEPTAPPRDREPEPVPDSGPSATRLVPPASMPQAPPPPPPAPRAPSAPPAPQAEPVLDSLRSRLSDLGVPGSAYRIGEPAEHGWSVERVDAGWRVGWYDQELTNPAVFGDAEDAAAFMLGKLLLDPRGREASPLPPPAPPRSDMDDTAPVSGGPRADRIRENLQEEPPAPDLPVRQAPEPPPPAPLAEPADAAPTMLAAPVPPPSPRRDPPPPPRREPARPAAPGSGQDGSGQQQWPVHPLPGEPPLTLFRGKEIRELPPGSELDRFGGPDGNLTYAAGTPFEERSLVPEWIGRPYHVYRVQRPLEALAGVAIPWFNQPGGGAAYLLPASIEELLAEGDLIELDPGEPPIA
jgi:hypothetical protein